MEGDVDTITWDVMRVTAIEPGAVGLYHLTTGQPRGMIAPHSTTSGWPCGVFTRRLVAAGQPHGWYILGHRRESISDVRGKREDGMRTRSGFT